MLKIGRHFIKFGRPDGWLAKTGYTNVYLFVLAPQVANVDRFF
jgi:hypothetical protein